MSSRFSFWRVHAPLGRGDLRPCFPIFTSTCCSSAGFGHGPWLPTSAFVPAPPSGGGGSWALGERVPRRPGAGCLEGGPRSESRGKQRAGSDCILQALEERSCALPGRKGDPEGTRGRGNRNCRASWQGPWLFAAPPPSAATGPPPRARAAAAVRPRAARGLSPSASEVSLACAPRPAARRGPAQALRVCALEPTSSPGLCSRSKHITSRGWGGPERGSKDQREHLSQKVIQLHLSLPFGCDSG